MKFRKDFVIRMIGQEHVILDPGQEVADLTSLFTLNESAVLLINTFKGIEFTHEDIISVLMDQYDVGREQAALDAQKWLQTIEGYGFFSE